MKLPRGYFATLLSIAILSISAYFGVLGRRSILSPAPTLSQIITESAQDAEIEPQTSEYTQVAVPPQSIQQATQVAPSSPTMIETLPTPESQPGEVFVKRVIDGDTIELERGQRVRLIGVDTPETVDPRKPIQCFGAQAKEFTSNLLMDQWVRLETDVSEKDKYGRTLAYVWRGEVFVNELLVKEGFARLLTIPPDVKYVEQFKQSQEEARIQKRGLWSACSD